MTRVISCAAVIALFTSIASAAAADITGKASVVDGDTIEIGSHTIRLFGIDAPEPAQTCTRDGMPWNCGQQATWALAYKLAEHWVSCRPRTVDRDTPVVATCYVGGSIDIADYMARSGWALADRANSQDYVAAEAEAQRARDGIWQGTFQKPWDWRRSR